MCLHSERQQREGLDANKLFHAILPELWEHGSSADVRCPGCYHMQATQKVPRQEGSMHSPFHLGTDISSLTQKLRSML